MVKLLQYALVKAWLRIKLWFRIDSLNHPIYTVEGLEELPLNNMILLKHLSCYTFNCSQKKSVAITLVLSVFFNAIFGLTNFSSDAFDFSSSKTEKQVAPSGHSVLLEPLSSVSAQTASETYFMVWRTVLRDWRHTHCFFIGDGLVFNFYKH